MTERSKSKRNLRDVGYSQPFYIVKIGKPVGERTPGYGQATIQQGDEYGLVF